MARDVIIACDFSNRIEFLEFLSKFNKRKLFVKVGLELFCSEGPDIVLRAKSMENKVFLDLKLHDIPNTVEKAARKISEFGVDMVTVHAAGGREMISAAKKGLSFRKNSTLLLAVTVLTSISQEILTKELLINNTLDEVVKNYALDARESGADGVICSPLEAAEIKRVCGRDFLAVSPGIRYESANDDQVRVSTPKQARELGSDFIVVGRPITNSRDPVGQYDKIIKDFLGKM
ncbi:MAG: orotidine-5'-phosphate decarboxylase [Oscillospiraceae bacterium]|jgi:orotidine-5'-phosphate decarboxylase|nr:orotidine-5'-phosphate decarboxylase [Oscillospiraceae bacterium]